MSKIFDWDFSGRKVFATGNGELIDYYKKTVNAYSRLDAEEEYRLFEIFRNEKYSESERQKAFRRILNSNLVVPILVVAYCYKSLSIDGATSALDHVQSANCGLVTAISKFDHTRHSGRFITCAIYWIRAELNKWNEEFSSVSKGINRNQYRTYVRAKRILAKGGTIEEASEHLGSPVKSIESLINHTQSVSTVCCLSVPIADHGPGPESALLKKEREAVITQTVQEGLRGLRESSHVSPRDVHVLEARMARGLDDHEFRGDIAKEVGISRERVRQIETRMMGLLKKRLLRDDAAQRVRQVIA